jgi:putative tricarboxylic transport membrane protein
MRISRQVAAGAIFVVIGGLAWWQAGAYSFGTSTHMGPGFFPTCLAILILLLGVGAIVQAVLRGDDDAPVLWDGRDLAFLLAGTLLFGALIDRAGLLVANAALLACACHGRLTNRPIEVAVLWAALSVFTGFVFIETFGLPFRWF